MKKQLFLISLITMFAIVSQAQFGLKAGATFSTVRGSDVSDVKSKVGFYAGPFYNIGISDNISVQAEAVYSAEGAKDNSSDDKIDLNYVNISALFRYNNSGFFAGTGPQYGILASAKSKSGGTTTDIKDAFKTGNFAWAFAAGYDLDMGLGFYARYALGLSKIGKEQGGVTPDIKTGCFYVGIRYNFNMGGEKEKK